MADVAEIAKCLSKAQREAAVATWDGDYRLSGILTSLVDLGLHKEIVLGERRKLRHTPLGLAVRDYLANQSSVSPTPQGEVE